MPTVDVTPVLLDCKVHDLLSCHAALLSHLTLDSPSWTPSSDLLCSPISRTGTRPLTGLQPITKQLPKSRSLSFH